MTDVAGCLVHALALVLLGSLIALPWRTSGDAPGLAGLLGFSFLAGFFLETQLLFVLLVPGLPLGWAVGLLYAAAVPAGLWRTGRWLAQRRRCRPRPACRPRWFELGAGVIAAEKVVFALALVLLTPALFDDPLQNWIGKGRALFLGVNWSWQPGDPAFLGFFGAGHYPLGLPIHRAVSALLAGGWSDAVGRFDGVPLFLAALAVLWATVRAVTDSRAVAAACAVFFSTSPFQAWTMAIGNADLAVQAFATGATAAALAGRWFLCGVLAAGAGFMKNDGLLIALPAALVLVTLLQPWRTAPRRGAGQLLGFALGAATLVPWLAFKSLYGLAAAPFALTFGWHADAPGQIWSKVIIGGTHGVFWLLLLPTLLATLPRAVCSVPGRALLGSWTCCALILVFIFGCTNAYVFLESEETIHRTALQLYGLTVFCAGLGLGALPAARVSPPLNARPPDRDPEPTPR